MVNKEISKINKFIRIFLQPSTPRKSLQVTRKLRFLSTSLTIWTRSHNKTKQMCSHTQSKTFEINLKKLGRKASLDRSWKLAASWIKIVCTRYPCNHNMHLHYNNIDQLLGERFTNFCLWVWGSWWFAGMRIFLVLYWIALIFIMYIADIDEIAIGIDAPNFMVNVAAVKSYSLASPRVQF